MQDKIQQHLIWGIGPNVISDVVRILSNELVDDMEIKRIFELSEDNHLSEKDKTLYRAVYFEVNGEQDETPIKL